MITKNFEQAIKPGYTLVFKWQWFGSNIIAHGMGDYWTHTAKVLEVGTNTVTLQEATGGLLNATVRKTTYTKAELTRLIKNKTVGILKPNFKYNVEDIAAIAARYDGLKYDKPGILQITIYKIFEIFKKTPKLEFITKDKVICSEHCARFDYDLSGGTCKLGYQEIEDAPNCEYNKSYDRLRPQEHYISVNYDVIKFIA